MRMTLVPNNVLRCCTRSFQTLLNQKPQSSCFQTGLFATARTKTSYSSFLNPVSYSAGTNQWRKRLVVGLCGSAALGGFCLSCYYNRSCLINKLSRSLLPIALAAEVVPDDPHEQKVFANRSHLNFIADVVEKVLPAVVYIEILHSHQTPFGWGTVGTSNGSGFIVRSDGLILTNSHVVGGQPGAQVTVKFGDGHVLSGYVQAVDPALDLATIKINPGKPLPFLNLGDSKAVRAGEWVIALGSPLSLSNTVTSGIVSSANRAASELGLHNKHNMHYIQTDALITFGNSGGPLVNLNGEVVGINNMKVSDGISFAIPSDFAKQFLEKAEAAEKKGGGVKAWFGAGEKKLKPSLGAKRYLGVRLLPLDPTLVQMIRARQPDFPEVETGVLVHSVYLDSPAYRCGLKPGDVITHIDGQSIGTAVDIYDSLEASSRLICTVVRKAETLKIVVDID